MHRTIKIPISVQEEVILPLLESCNEIFNIYVEWSFEHKSYNKSKAHNDLYFNIRELYPSVPSGLIQTIRDNALGSIKALKFRFRPNKSKFSAISFDKRTSSLRGNLLTFSTLVKRQKVMIDKVPKYAKEVFDTWDFTGMQIKYDRQKRKVFACLGFKKDAPQFQEGETLGIDRGIKNTVYCSNGYSVSGKKRNRIKRKHSYNRKQLQAKGTRSSKRALARLKGREKRFSLNENHVLSQKLVNLDYSVFVLEKLEKFKKNKGKRFNRKVSNWSYYQLELFLIYKSEALGKKVEYIDPRYTSQKCNMCNHVAKSNRKGDYFSCRECGHSDHSDLNAAKNIRDLYLHLQANAKIPSGQAAANQPNESLKNSTIQSSPGFSPDRASPQPSAAGS